VRSRVLYEIRRLLLLYICRVYMLGFQGVIHFITISALGCLFVYVLMFCCYNVLIVVFMLYRCARLDWVNKRIINLRTRASNT
jgi:hypothetical protein